MPDERALGDEMRRELRARLRESRSQLLRTVVVTEEELATLQGREPGAPVEDAAREAIVGILARLGERERREMEDVDAALARLGAGTYGVCERCGGRIPLSRLRAKPAARHCVTCQAIQE
jgi:RNA polymerase-binding protein DksA